MVITAKRPFRKKKADAATGAIVRESATAAEGAARNHAIVKS